jgi:hypothetical protein
VFAVHVDLLETVGGPVGTIRVTWEDETGPGARVFHGKASLHCVPFDQGLEGLIGALAEELYNVAGLPWMSHLEGYYGDSGWRVTRHDPDVGAGCPDGSPENPR